MGLGKCPPCKVHGRVDGWMVDKEGDRAPPGDCTTLHGMDRVHLASAIVALQAW